MHRRCRLLPIVLLAVLLLPASGQAQAVDCSAFDSQIWAQSVYDTDPAGYAGLDPDGNGLACEELSPGAAPALWTNQIPAGSQPATIASVTDGDTVRVIVGGIEEPVRLILIDTPETQDPNSPVECFGQEATAFTTWLLSLGGQLYLESDVTDRDRYDRLLRYVWLDFGDGHAYLVNEAIVRAGYGALYTYPPDVKYVEQIRAAATFAREHGYGLWSSCQTDAEGDTNELTGAAGDVGVPVESAPDPAPAEPASSSDACDPSYPDPGVCIPPIGMTGDLDCGDIVYRRFTVFPPDPHGFDGDFDGIGCER